MWDDVTARRRPVIGQEGRMGGRKVGRKGRRCKGKGKRQEGEGGSHGRTILGVRLGFHAVPLQFVTNVFKDGCVLGFVCLGGQSYLIN